MQNLVVYEIDSKGEITDKGRAFHTLPHLTPKLRRDLMAVGMNIISQMSKDTIETFRKTFFENEDILKLIGDYFQWIMENGYEMDLLATILIEDGKTIAKRSLADIQEVKTYLENNMPDGKTPEIISTFFAMLETHQILEAYISGWEKLTEKTREALKAFQDGK